MVIFQPDLLYLQAKLLPKMQEKIEICLFNNYYMKLASYRANYDKRKSNDEYINLDFAYLKELSTIDMYLRYIILQMCLDIEHALKTRLLKDIEDNLEEDGYDNQAQKASDNGNLKEDGAGDTDG